MLNYRPYDIRMREIQALVDAEDERLKNQYANAATGVEAYNATLPGPGPTGYRRPQGQVMGEPLTDYRVRIAKGKIDLLQKQIDEAKVEEERQLKLKGGETAIEGAEATTGKTIAETEQAQEATAGAKQTRGIIENLRKAGVVGMEEGKITTKPSPEKWSDSDKNELNILKADKGKIQTAIQKLDTDYIKTDEEKATQRATLDTELNNIQNSMDVLFKKNETRPLRMAPPTDEVTPKEEGAPPVLYRNAQGQLVMTNVPRPDMPEDLRSKVSGITGAKPALEALPEGLSEDIIQENLTRYGSQGVKRQDIIDRYKMMKGIEDIPPVGAKITPEKTSFKQAPPYYTVGQGAQYKDKEGNILAHDKYSRKFIKFNKTKMRWESMDGKQYYNGNKWISIEG